MPLTLDRSATLRAVVAGLLCLVVFWTSSHYADRLSRLYLIWGSVVAAFLLNGCFALVQIASGSEGLLGMYPFGRGPSWAPSTPDSLKAPGETVFRVLVADTSSNVLLPDARPVPKFEFGTIPGGADSFLALGAIAIPLAIAICLHMMAPRGSRSGLWFRLRESGHAPVLTLTIAMLLLASVVTGLFAGVLGVVPFVAGVLFIGASSSASTGLGWKSLVLSTCVAGVLVVSARLGEDQKLLARSGLKVPKAETIEASRAVWNDSKSILKDHPIVGVGLGAFPTVFPYYKTTDVSSTTAKSELLTLLAETGLVGGVLLGVALLWCLFKIPGACLRVGTADRTPAFGCVGLLLCFGLVSATRWTVDCFGIAVAAAAVGGTLNRWLSGATDLFLEQG